MECRTILFRLVSCSVLVVVAPVAAGAQSPQPLSDLNAESRALVERMVAERAAFLAADRRIAEEQKAELLAELNDRERRLQEEIRLRAGAETELTGRRAELEEVRAERRDLVDQLAEQDRRFAAEIAEYRQQVASIAGSPDPRKREALQRYDEGDREGAFNALVDIQRAETKAVAAGWREIGALALDRLDRGEMTTADVIPIYEDAQRLDPEHTWGWLDLRRLLQEAGRLQDARRAAEQALTNASSDPERSAAAGDMGDVEVLDGNLHAARQHFEVSFAIDQRLAKANPASADTQRNLSIGFERLGKVELSSDNLQAARQAFLKSLAISRLVAELHPASADAQRGLSINLEWLGRVELAAENLEAARRYFQESLTIARELARQDLKSAKAQRDLGVTLNKMASLEVATGNFQAARRKFEQSLAIAQRLAKANPTSARARGDVISTLNRIGHLDHSLERLEAARQEFEQSLTLAQHLAEANPTSVRAQRTLRSCLVNLGDVEVDAGNLQTARQRFEQSLAIAQDLVEGSPASAAALRSLSISIERLGQVEVEAGNLELARRRFELSRTIRENLARSNPTSADAQRDLSTSLEWLGYADFLAGDPDSAQRFFEQSLAIREGLAEANPASARAQRDSMLTHRRLAELPGGEDHFIEAREIAERLFREGRLTPKDGRLFLELQRRVRNMGGTQ